MVGFPAAEFLSELSIFFPDVVSISPKVFGETNLLAIDPGLGGGPGGDGASSEASVAPGLFLGGCLGEVPPGGPGEEALENLEDEARAAAAAATLPAPVVEAPCSSLLLAEGAVRLESFFALQLAPRFFSIGVAVSCAAALPAGEEKAFCTAAAAALSVVPGAAFLNNSGRETKYSSKRPKKASFSPCGNCEKTIP